MHSKQNKEPDKQPQSEGLKVIAEAILVWRPTWRALFGFFKDRKVLSLGLALHMAEACIVSGSGFIAFQTL